MRNVLVIFIVSTGLLVFSVGLYQHHLTASIKNRIADAATILIEKHPVDHKQTLFSGILLEQVAKDSPYYINNWHRTVASYELVTMSPCNPRIQRCG